MTDFKIYCCSIDHLWLLSVLHCKSTSNGTPNGEHSDIYRLFKCFLSVLFSYLWLCQTFFTFTDEISQIWSLTRDQFYPSSLIKFEGEKISSSFVILSHVTLCFSLHDELWVFSYTALSKTHTWRLWNLSERTLSIDMFFFSAFLPIHSYSIDLYRLSKLYFFLIGMDLV